MFLELMKMAVLVVMLVCFLSVVWLFLKNTGKRILQVRKGNRVKGIIRVVLTAAGWLLVVWVCYIFLYIAGSIVISNMDRYVPKDPPKWEEVFLSERFPYLKSVKILSGGDPGNHRFNQKVRDYLIYIEDPSDATAFRHDAGEVMGWHEVSANVSSEYLSYIKGYEHYFTKHKETGFIWKNGKREYDFSIHEGQEGYFYISVIMR